VTGILWQKKLLMKWSWEQCTHYVDSHYLLTTTSLGYITERTRQRIDVILADDNYFREQIMTLSAKAKVNILLVPESHQLCEQTNPNIPAAMVAVLYWAEIVSTTKCQAFWVRLDRARHAATTWSDADHQKGIEHLDSEIHPVTPVKQKGFQ
jgi:hypothetical protein